MAEIIVRFDVRMGPRMIKGAVAAALLFTAVPELGSESLTLSTYYPAPSGIYTKMITTAEAYLARDGGNVLVGASAVTGTGAKLYMPNGDMLWGNRSRLQTDQGGAIELGGDNSTAGTGAPYIDFHRTGGGVQDFNVRLINDANGQLTLNANANITGTAAVASNLTVNGTSSVVGDSSVGGNSAVTGKQTVNQHLIVGGATYGGCILTSGAKNTVLCPGRYATTISGVYAKYMAAPIFQQGSVDTPTFVVSVLCCDYPTGGFVF